MSTIQCCYMTGDALPIDIIAHIFSYLKKNDLLSYATTCKDRHIKASLNELWRKYFPGLPYIPNGFEIKQKYILGITSIYSAADLRIHFSRFLTELKIHQIGVFKCIFPCNPKHSLEIKVQFASKTKNVKRINKICCYIGKLSNKNLQEYSIDDRMSSINYKAKMNAWAKNFFISAEALTYKKYLKVNGVKTTKEPPVKWISTCLSIIGIAFIVFVLFPALLITSNPRPFDPVCIPPPRFDMSIANLSTPVPKT